MSRNVWWHMRLKEGQLVTFQNKTYKVLSQGSQMDSYHFKARYYTTLWPVPEKDVSNAVV